MTLSVTVTPTPTVCASGMLLPKPEPEPEFGAAQSLNRSTSWDEYRSDCSSNASDSNSFEGNHDKDMDHHHTDNNSYKHRRCNTSTVSISFSVAHDEQNNNNYNEQLRGLRTQATGNYDVDKEDDIFGHHDIECATALGVVGNGGSQLQMQSTDQGEAQPLVGAQAQHEAEQNRNAKSSWFCSVFFIVLLFLCGVIACCLVGVFVCGCCGSCTSDTVTDSNTITNSSLIAQYPTGTDVDLDVGISYEDSLQRAVDYFKQFVFQPEDLTQSLIGFQSASDSAAPIRNGGELAALMVFLGPQQIAQTVFPYYTHYNYGELQQFFPQYNLMKSTLLQWSSSRSETKFEYPYPSPYNWVELQTPELKGPVTPAMRIRDSMNFLVGLAPAELDRIKPFENDAAKSQSQHDLPQYIQSKDLVQVKQYGLLKGPQKPWLNKPGESDTVPILNKYRDIDLEENIDEQGDNDKNKKQKPTSSRNVYSHRYTPYHELYEFQPKIVKQALQKQNQNIKIFTTQRNPLVAVAQAHPHPQQIQIIKEDKIKNQQNTPLVVPAVKLSVMEAMKLQKQDLYGEYGMKFGYNIFGGKENNRFGNGDWRGTQQGRLSTVDIVRGRFVCFVPGKHSPQLQLIPMKNQNKKGGDVVFDKAEVKVKQVNKMTNGIDKNEINLLENGDIQFKGVNLRSEPLNYTLKGSRIESVCIGQPLWEPGNLESGIKARLSSLQRLIDDQQSPRDKIGQPNSKPEGYKYNDKIGLASVSRQLKSFLNDYDDVIKYNDVMEYRLSQEEKQQQAGKNNQHTSKEKAGTTQKQTKKSESDKTTKAKLEQVKNELRQVAGSLTRWNMQDWNNNQSSNAILVPRGQGMGPKLYIYKLDIKKWMRYDPHQFAKKQTQMQMNENQNQNDPKQELGLELEEVELDKEQEDVSSDSDSQEKQKQKYHTVIMDDEASEGVRLLTKYDPESHRAKEIADAFGVKISDHAGVKAWRQINLTADKS